MPTINLDNLEEIKKLDSKDMLGSLNLLSKQIDQILKQSVGFKAPVNYKKVQNLVVAGMGGSTLGAHIIKSLFFSELKIPVEIVNSYHLPAYVNSKTLVLVSSYSGTTEESIACFKEAKIKKAKILVIAAGGALADLAQKNKLPSLIFSTENNPCGSPRMGLGYSIFGQIILLSKIGLLKVSNAQIKQAVKIIEKYTKLFGAENPQEKNLAKQLAGKLGERSVWYVASEHLAGNAHTGANQINENAKRFAGYFLVPELNHHLMEGLLNPVSNKQELAFVLLESKKYDARVQKRYEITKQILEKNNLFFVNYECQEKDKLAQVGEMLVFTSFVSFYLAMLAGIDPTAIPFVDFFKAQLKK